MISTTSVSSKIEQLLCLRMKPVAAARYFSARTMPARVSRKTGLSMVILGADGKRFLISYAESICNCPFELAATCSYSLKESSGSTKDMVGLLSINLPPSSFSTSGQ